MAPRLYFLSFLIICLTGIYHPLEGTQNTKVKAIVFDFGGVMTKTDKDQITDFIVKGIGVSRDDALQALDRLKEQPQNDALESDFWQSFAKSKGKTLPDDWMKQLNEVRLHAQVEIPGMVQLVKSLKAKGYQTALLSNVRKSRAEIKRKLGLYDLFHPTLFSYEVGVRKPDPKSYQLLLEKLNLPPEAVIFIDNKPENIAAAKAVGIDGILFEDPNQLFEALRKRGIPFEIHCQATIERN